MLTLQSKNDSIIQIPYRSKQRVGILLSGGLDSGLLLNILDIACTDCTFMIFTMDKPDGSLRYADDIIKRSNLRNKWESVVVRGGKEDEVASLGPQRRPKRPPIGSQMHPNGQTRPKRQNVQDFSQGCPKIYQGA